MLDVRRAVAFITEDGNAPTKIAVGSLLLAIPLANIAAMGYEVEVARRVARSEPQPLPDWNDLGALFVTGSWLALARVVYFIPVLAALLIGFLAGFGLILQSAQSPHQPAPDVVPALIVAGVCQFGALLAYGFLVGFISQAILAEYARCGTFAACFDMAALFRFVRRAPGQYALAWLAEIGFGLAAAATIFFVILVLGLIPCLGSLAVPLAAGLAGFIVLLFNSHVTGQLMRAGAHPESMKESEKS